MGITEVVTAEYQRRTWKDESTTAYFPVIDYGYLTDRDNSFDVPLERLRPAGRAYLALENAFSSWGFDLRINGTLARLWKKFYLPNTRELVQVDPGAFEAESATFGTSVPFSIAGPTISIPFPFDAPTPDMDPSGNYAAPGFYVTPAAMTVRPILRLKMDVLNGTPMPDGFYAFLQIADTTAGNFIATYPPFFLTDDLPTVDGTFDFGPLTVPAGHNLGLRIMAHDGTGTLYPAASFDFYACEIQWKVENIPYTEGYPLVVSQLYPDLTVMELFKAIFANRCLVVETNTARGTVDVWQDQEYFQTIDKGIDWRERISHEEPPTKVLPIPPSRMEFRFKEDNKDGDLKAVNDSVGAPGYGNYDHVFEEGSGDAKKVELPFAATAMGTILKNDTTGSEMFVPIMRKLDGTYQEDDYDRAPRLMIANGVTSAQWVHDGDSINTYPISYFIRAGQPFTMSFGSGSVYGDAQGGTAQVQYSYRLQRMVSPTLKAMAKIYPDEVWSASFGTPRLIRDGFTDVWCYVVNIDQFKFTGDELTETTFIPL